MKKEKTPAAISMVEGFEAFKSNLKKLLIILAMCLLTIRVIREKAEEQIGLFIGKVSDFELFHLFPNLRRIHQQDGYNDERSERVRNPRNLEIHFRKSARRQQPHEKVIQKIERKLAGGDQQEERD